MPLYIHNSDPENCYPLSYFKENFEGEIELIEAVKIKVPGVIYCKATEYFTQSVCGKQCELYDPKNGKSGCCKHLGSLYEEGEKRIIIKGKKK